MKYIYAEYELSGIMHYESFFSWDEYHAAAFNPEIEIKTVRIIRH